MQEFLNALKNGKGYDYLANNAHNMRKEDLKRIAMELLFELTRDYGFLDCPTIDNVIDELQDYV